MYASQEDRQLGIAPAVVALAPAAVSSVSKVLKGLTGGTPKQRQKKREAEYNTLYASAITGDASALDKLLGFSRGAATKEAKAYAKKKYDAAVALLASKGFTVSSQTGTTIPQTGGYTAPVQQASMFGGIPAPVLIGGGVLALILFLRRK